jgi:hypothetical protein
MDLRRYMDGGVKPGHDGAVERNDSINSAFVLSAYAAPTLPLPRGEGGSRQSRSVSTHPYAVPSFETPHWVDSEAGDRFAQNSHEERKNRNIILEDAMTLILIIVVLFLLFGGGGYYGYSRWR